MKVVANSVSALLEIKENSARKDIFSISNNVLTKLLTALNESTEWGQICILEALAGYKPVDGKEAEMIAERVLPRLQHVNSSVVLTAVKVLAVYLDHVQDQEALKNLTRKLSPPLGRFLLRVGFFHFVGGWCFHFYFMFSDVVVGSGGSAVRGPAQYPLDFTKTPRHSLQ